jgi:hypothetical protein
METKIVLSALQDMEQLRSYLIIAASGMGLIGLPILITLLIRMQDVRAKVFEKRSPKAINDELSAFKELQSQEEISLAVQVEARRVALTEMTSKVDLLNSPDVSRITTELNQLSFFVGTERGRKFWETALRDLTHKGMLQDIAQKKVQDCAGQIVFTMLLAGYKESLERQLSVTEEAAKLSEIQSGSPKM